MTATAERTDSPARRPPDLLAETWNSRPGIVGWLGAVNHKQIGTRFLVTSFAFFLVGGVQALLIRAQLATADGTVLGGQAYNEVFTMHGTTMMFLFAVPVVEGLGIYFLPLLVGARDLPFPRLTAFGYWAYLAGGLLLYSSYLTGDVPDSGWFAYTPLSSTGTPGPSMDYWLLGVTFVEISGLVGAFELVVCVLRGRAPGMTLAQMPIFAWGILVTSGMILFAFPPLIVGSLLLELERKLGLPFYDPAGGGDPLLWQHLFWFFGHPEVYIIVLPAMGVISTLLPVFTRSRLVGHTLLVAATVGIGVISFGLWVHHMFTVGLPFFALSLFALGSFVIAIPSGVQVFSWLATMWQGRLVWRTPLLFVIGFFVIFVNGGITGVMVASAPFDTQAHDSQFVVAHLHYVLIGGMVFPVLAGVYYWWPKITGRLLSERLGRHSFWWLLVAFNVTFLVLHWVGLLGMPRRVYTYSEATGWESWNLIASVGAVGLGVGVALTLANCAWSLRRGPAAGPDPWGGHSLDWSVPSPPPPYNFREVPVATTRYPLWEPQDRRVADAVPVWVARPTQPLRHVWLTSPVQAVPDEVVTLPAHSLLPLVTALAIAVGLVGVLLDVGWLAVLGLAVLVATLLAWGWSRQETK